MLLVNWSTNAEGFWDAGDLERAEDSTRTEYLLNT